VSYRKRIDPIRSVESLRENKRRTQAVLDGAVLEPARLELRCELLIVTNAVEVEKRARGRCGGLI